jgi:hypothetical protein
MARQEPILFGDFPVRKALDGFFLGEPEMLPQVLKSLFPRNHTTLAKLGPSKRARYLRVHDVIEGWVKDRATLSANDIFFRNLKLDRVFDCAALSDFNVLCNAREEISRLEVATMLLGTTGCMTDSHADDPDGTNHCICGRKLWLVWDRHEGQRNGLESCEHDAVYDRAKFDIHRFASLKSSKWFVMSRGLTLFLPGHLTHKVICLEQYLGISSFYVSLPNALACLARWKLSGTLMVTEENQAEIAGMVIDQLKKTAGNGLESKRRWGFFHVRAALSCWRARFTPEQRRRMLAENPFNELVTAMSSYCS